MIGYFCKYAPIEIFKGFDEECVLISALGSKETSPLIHPNLCSFIKASYEAIKCGNYSGVILTTCCDSTRRLYDILKAEFKDKFIYLLDLPRSNSKAAFSLYEKRIEELIRAYEAYSSKRFDYSKFKACSYCKVPDPRFFFRNKRKNVLLMGARMNPEIKSVLLERDVNIVADLSCTGVERSVDTSQGIEEYAESLMEQYPCARMRECGRRFQSDMERVDGIIYHTIQFCDLYSFEYANASKLNVPVLYINSDYSDSARGQIKTRVEAFLEEIGEKKESHVDNGGAFVIGIDSGSTSTNGVVMDRSGKIVDFSSISTGAKAEESSKRLYKELLERNKLNESDIASTIATGYGRVSISFSDESVTEISCHARGAYCLNRSVRTILDIGGQDSKAISIRNDGSVKDFVMNDKCAAGTGRFLESIARTLELSTEELGNVSLKAKKEIEITSMCTVFAESEVISLIAENNEIEDIAYGVCSSIASKSISLLKRVGIEDVVMMSGGVARNKGVVKALEAKLGKSIFIPENPELVGALGAASIALERLSLS